MKEPDPRCDAAKGANVYSNASYSEETGDVGGFELAVFGGRRALLFDYEGTPWAEPIPLEPGKKLGLWDGLLRRKLVQQPSGREVIDEVSANVKGNLSAEVFRGTIQIGHGKAERLSLK